MKKLFFILISLLMVFVAVAQSPEPAKPVRGNFFHQKGFSNMLESGIGISRSPGDPMLSTSYFINYVYGYQHNKVLFTGMSIGLRKYMFILEYQSFAHTQLPVSLYAKANLIKNRFSPFLAASIGGSHALTKGFGWVGIVGTGQVGLNISLSSRMALSIATGYENQRMTVSETDPHTDWIGTTTFGRQAMRYYVALQF